MPLYYYKKAKVEARKPKKQGVLVATILDNISRKIGSRLSSAKPISFIIPLIFIISGLGILYSQIKPYAMHFIRSRFSDRLDQEIIPLVPESYDEIRAEYISDPGARYFSDLLETESQQQQPSDYEGKFYLTIEKVKIFDAPVTANVDSTSEEIYEKALSQGLAHFKGTRIPGEDGNVFIYGHSAAGDYADKHPKDPVTAFTRLFKLNIGDKISIKIDDNEINYVIKKIKEVNPQDVDILNGNSSGKTLTLMTCSPPGLSSNRLIVIAIQQ